MMKSTAIRSTISNLMSGGILLVSRKSLMLHGLKVKYLITNMIIRMTSG